MNMNLMSAVLGSDEDISQVQHAPLQRALFCLKNALNLYKLQFTNMDKADANLEETIRTTLAYIYLELGDAVSVLDISRPILSRRLNSVSTSRASSKRIGLLRLYACEASCLLGKPTEALNWLMLSTIEEDDSQQPKEDICLEKLTESIKSCPKRPCDNINSEQAATIVYAAACATYATNGMIDLAEHYARKAFEKGSRQSIDALLYCLLKRGNTEGALKVLQMSTGGIS